MSRTLLHYVQKTVSLFCFTVKEPVLLCRGDCTSHYVQETVSLFCFTVKEPVLLCRGDCFTMFKRLFHCAASLSRNLLHFVEETVSLCSRDCFTVCQELCSGDCFTVSVRLDMLKNVCPCVQIYYLCYENCFNIGVAVGYTRAASITTPLRLRGPRRVGSVHRRNIFLSRTQSSYGSF